MPLHPQAQAYLDLLASVPSVPREQMTVALAREGLDAGLPPPGEPEAVARVRDCLVDGGDGPRPARLYTPPGEGPFGVVLYLHGGGWIAGSLHSHDATCRALCNASGCLVLSLDYRLAPEHKFPAGVLDGLAALRWLAAHAAELGGDAARLAIAGDSAGGNLAAVVAQLARDAGGPPLRMQLLVYPVTGRDFDTPSHRAFATGHLLTLDSLRWHRALYLPDDAAGADPRVAPLCASDLRGLPPALVITAEYDPLRDEGEAYAQRLREAGVPTELVRYDGMVHAFFSLGHLMDDGRAAIQRAGAALRATLAPAATPELIARLKAMLPGIPDRDLSRFASSQMVAEPYALGADSQRDDAHPRGNLSAHQCASGRHYPGVAHDYTVYVAAQVNADRPAALMVFQDGARYLGPEIDVPAVLDRLIAEGAIPPTVAVFVNPGASGPGLPIYGGNDNRSLEYDSLGDTYVRFLIEELLPAATEGLSISADPAQRAIVGLSSGGACAFNAAWERPEAFGKVVSHCGSFVDIRGAHQLAPAVRRGPVKALKVFLQTGEHDLNIVFGDWVLANRTLASALAYRGIEHQLVVGHGGHSLRHGGAIFPDTLRWLWSDTTP